MGSLTATELHLFAGCGGGILGGMLLGHTPVCAVEIDKYCQRVLRARQADGYLPADMEIHDDVTTFDGHQWRGRVDIVAGGFPCQDISIAGKGKGIDGERSGLWWHMQRIIREVRPKYCFVENAPTLVGRGLHRVLGSLAEIGYDAEWCVLGARHVGAPHRRDRIWILAADADRRNDVSHAESGQSDGRDTGVMDSTAKAGESGYTTAGASCPHDPNPNCGRCEEQRVTQRSEQRSETGDQPHRLCPWGRRDGADLADATDDGCQGREGVCRDQRQTLPSEQGNQRRSIGRWCEFGRCGESVLAANSDSNLPRCAQQRCAVAAESQQAGAKRAGVVAGPFHAPQPGMGRGVDGLAAWLDRSAAGFWRGQWETTPRVTLPPKNRTNRLHALGNGQVPQCAAAAFRLLQQRMHTGA